MSSIPKVGWAVAFLLVVLTSATASAQTGDITGTVTDAGSGEPLVARLSEGLNVGVTIYSADGTLYGTTTIFEPTYRFGLPVGTYYLKAHATRHVPQLHANQPCSAADCRVTSGTPIVVTAGTLTTVNFALTEGGRISGIIQAEDSPSPVAPSVTVYNASGSAVKTLEVVPADNRQFSIEGLASGTYYLLVHPWRDYLSALYAGKPCAQFAYASDTPCAVTLGTPIVVNQGQTTSGIDVTLKRGATLTGIVKTEAGEPVSAQVSLWSADREIASSLTQSMANYTFVGLPAGTYRVRTRVLPVGSTSEIVDEWAGGLCVGCPGTPAAVTLTAGTTTTVNFELATGGAIAGSLSCCGGVVVVHDARGEIVRQWDFGGFAATPAPIAYRMGGLSAGTYYVRAYDPAATGLNPSLSRGSGGDQLYGGAYCAAEDCDVRRGTPVVVRTGETTSGINFNMGSTGTISGTLPGFAWTAEVFDARGVRLRGRITGPWAGDSQPLNFSVVGLPAGVYYVRLVPRGSPQPPVPILHNGGLQCSDCPVTSGRPVVVGVDVPAVVTFESRSGRSIRGTVRDAADASVLSTIRVEAVTRGGAVIATDVSDAAGGFWLRGLAPGTYFLRTFNTRGFVDEVYADVACATCDISRGTPVVLTADADVTDIAMTLTRGSIVTGAVRTTGIPLAGTGLTFFGSNAVAAARASSGPLGEYVANVPRGTVFARSDPRAGFRQELYQDVTCASGACDVTTGTPIATNSGPVQGVNFTLDTCSGMAIAPVRLANAAVGATYRQTLTVAGGTPPLLLTVDGQLPPGLTLDPSSGRLSGTPTEAGRYTFTVSAADAGGCVTRREYTLDVPACAFTLSSDSVSLAASGAPWMIQVSNACGTWTATSDQPWLKIGSSSASFVVVAADPNPLPTRRTAIVTIGPRAFTVFQSGQVSSEPFGVFETPAEGATVSGSIAVSGWALDDIAVSRVHIYRDAVGGSGPPAFIGEATFVEGARPDVEAAFPLVPRKRHAGWGYLLLTNMLPNGGNGTFRLHALAQDSWTGGWVSLGTRTIRADNSSATLPFGAIDTPQQGETISGSSYINWGWALTPQPQAIPTSGATIQVYIDGVPIGPVTEYNLFRSDIAGLFPGRANSAGPVAYRRFDTTTLEEGLHTISWLVTDDAGRSEGIGSRYFNVRNSAWTASATSLSTAGGVEAAEAAALDLPARVAGVDVERSAHSLTSLPIDRGAIVRRREDAGWSFVPMTAAGERRLNVAQLERLELNLSAGVVDACAPTYAAYFVANGELRDLPVGARVRADGQLYWQLAPGFLGSYEFIIVRTDCGGARSRIPVQVEVSRTP